MLKAHSSVFCIVLLSSIFKTCTRDVSYLSRTEAKASAAKYNTIGESAANIKGAVEDFHYLSDSEKRIMNEHKASLKEVEESAALKESNFNLMEEIRDKILEEARDQLIEWGFEKYDILVTTHMAAKSIAYSPTGEMLAKIIRNKEGKKDINRDDIFELLVGNSVGDLFFSEQLRMRILYKYSNDYAVWVLARLVTRINCNNNKLMALKNIASERKINKDNRLIQAFKSCE